MIGSEYETAVAVVPVVADAPSGKTGLHDLAFQVLRYRTAPAAVKEDIVLHSGEVGRSQRSIVVQAECVGLFREGLVLFQVHVRLEDPGQDGEV